MNSDPISEVEFDSPSLIHEAKLIIDSVADGKWQQGKIFKTLVDIGDGDGGHSVDVSTYTTTLNNKSWFSRSATLNKEVLEKKRKGFEQCLIGSFDLDKNHSYHEKQYIHELYDYEVKPVEVAKSGDNGFSYLLKAYYRFPFPIKRRVFYELVHIVKSDDYDMIVSVAIQPQFYGDNLGGNGFVVGNYNSVEIIYHGEELKWTMCTTSDPRGLIPNWLTKMSTPNAIAKDVPSFLNYLNRT